MTDKYTELNIEREDEFFRLLGRMAWDKAIEDERTVIKFGMTPVTLLEKMNLDPNKDGVLLKGFALGLMDRAGKEMRV